MRCFRLIAAVVLLANVLAYARAAETPAAPTPRYSKVVEIIDLEGDFVFVDGSSYFRFSKDGTFDSGPMGMSGRTIDGTWSFRDDYVIVVEGEWGWMNGISSRNDRRRMVVTVQPPFSLVEDSPRRREFLGTPKPRVYRCYCTIDELVRYGSKDQGR